MKKACFFISLSFLFTLSHIALAQISNPETINFSTTDNTNLGPVANDGEGGSTDITGVQIDIFSIDASGAATGEDLFYNANSIGFGAVIEEGISITTDPSLTAWRGVSIKSNDGSEFDFNGFESWEFSFAMTVTFTVEGFKNGASTGSITTTSALGDRKEHAVSEFSDAIFGDVDEVRIISDVDFYGTFDVFLLGAVTQPNSVPTFTSFSGPVETTTQDTGVEITFADLAAVGDEADADGFVEQFAVQSVSSGTLTIIGAPYDPIFNFLINADFTAIWTPPAGQTGTLNAFTVKAVDNQGAESSTAIQASVLVNSASAAPSITTSTATSLTTTTATLNGDVTSDGNDAVTERGFVYAKTSDDATPTLAEVNGSTIFKVTVTGTTGVYNSSVTGLLAGTNYSYIAYATNSQGTTEGSVQTFSTSDPTIAFASTSSSAAESVSSADLQVNLSSASSKTITVDYTVSGTATGSGTDFTLADGTLTFTASETSKNITIASIVDDAILEANETVIVTLSNPTNSSLGTNTVHTYTITNNDAAAVTIADISGNEDDGPITVTATLDNAVAGGFTVDVSSADGTATTADGDYTALSGTTLTFSGTASETQTFTITPTSDADIESNEILTLAMSNLSTNLAVDVSDVATVTITNDDFLSVSFAASSSAGDEATASADIQVSLSGASQSVITVDYTIAGTASGSGTDYTLANGTLTFNASETNKNLTISNIVDDALDEEDETVVITLSNPTNAILGVNTTHTYTISDNDPAPTVSFTNTSSSGSESTASANIEVSLSAPSGKDVNVDFTVSGTATGNGTDYTLADGTLTFGASETSKNITIASIVDDALLEIDETVVVTLSNPSNASLGANTIYTYTVLDNDNTVPEFTSSPVTEIRAGEEYNYEITTTDVDGDVVTVTAPTLPSWLTLNAANSGIHTVSTFAGSGSQGSADGNGTSASFNRPYGVTVDASGNIYVADQYNRMVRKITPNGEVSRVAGSGANSSVDGNGTSASFGLISGIAADASGNLYVADGRRVRKIAPNADVTTIAGSGTGGNTDGNGTSATFGSLNGIAVDASGNIYVTDGNNHNIRKIAPNGDVTTVAGSGSQGSADGNGTSATFYSPNGIAVDASGNLYVVDAGSHLVRKITSNGDVTTIAGSGQGGSVDGNGTSASFTNPTGIAVDASGNLYVADYLFHKIRKINPNGDVTTIAGSGSSFSEDGDGLSAGISLPLGIAIDASGVLYVTEELEHKVRKITPPIDNYSLTGNTTGNTGDHSVVLRAEDGRGGFDEQSFTITVQNTAPEFTSSPVTEIRAGEEYNYEITTTDVDGDVVTVTAPTLPSWLTLNAANSGIHTVSTFAGSGSQGSADGNGTSASFNRPYGVTVDASGNIYVADQYNRMVRKITPNGEVSRVAGSGANSSVDGNGTSASFGLISGIAADASGNLYVADGRRVRKIAPNADVTTIAGSGTGGNTDGNGTSATFGSLNGIAVDASGNIYVTDGNNHNIRKIAPNGDVTTVAGSGSQGSADGNGTSATFYSPNGIAVDASGNLYVVDAGSHLVRKITSNGDVTTIAGSGQGGSVDGNGTSASFTNPTGIAVDASGNLYVADYLFHKIRKINPNGDVTTIAGSGSSFSEDGDGLSAGISLPLGIAIDASGVLYVTEELEHKVRKITPPIDNYSLTGNTTGNTGDHSVVLRAEDGRGGFDEQSFTISVQNTAPEFTSTPVTEIRAGEEYNYEITTTDVDGDVVTVTAPTLPEWLTLKGVTSRIVSTINTSPIGDTNINDIAFDALGNFYVSSADHRIYKVSSEGDVSVFAGSGDFFGRQDGNGTAASFFSPRGLVFDASGNLFVADGGGDRIRKITPNGDVTTYAGRGMGGQQDGTGTDADFDGPYGMDIDASGTLYVADKLNHKIRKIVPTSDGSLGIVTTVSGDFLRSGYEDGDVSTARFDDPLDIAVDANGDLYLIEDGKTWIRKISNGQVSLFVELEFSPDAIEIDASGDIYVTHISGGYRVARVTPNGEVSTVAGSGVRESRDGEALSASFTAPRELKVDASGNIFVVDASYIRKVTPAVTNYSITGNTIGNAGDHSVVLRADDGRGGVDEQSFTISIQNTDPEFSSTPITEIRAGEVYNYEISTSDADGDELTVTAPTLPDWLTLENKVTRTVSTINNSPISSENINDLTFDASGNFYVSSNDHRIYKVDAEGNITVFAGSGDFGRDEGNGTSASFIRPRGLVTDASGNIYVADSGGDRIRKITPNGDVTTYAGAGFGRQQDGTGAGADFDGPSGMAIDATGTIYVTDKLNHKIRKIVPTSDGKEGIVTTVSGEFTNSGYLDGDVSTAMFERPLDIVVDNSGDLYLIEETHKSIRKISNGQVSTFITLDFYPNGIEIDDSGNLYVTDRSGYKLVKVTSNGETSILAGSGRSQYLDGDVSTAAFEYPAELKIDASGNIYVLELSRIRKISAPFRKYSISGNTLGNTGDHNVVLKVDDSKGGVNEQSFTIKVVNSAPVFTSTPVTEINGSESYTYEITTTDADGEAVTLTAPTLPDWLTFEREAKSYTVTTLAGTGVAGKVDGNGGSASFSKPTGVTVDADGNIYVADRSNHLIRKISPQGVVTTVAGSGFKGDREGNGTRASFNSPTGITIDDAGNLYVADQGNYKVRKITPNGDVTTFAGSGAYGSDDANGESASFGPISDLVFDKAGNLYVTDQGNYKIRKITPNRDVTTLAGSGGQGSRDGDGTIARFEGPAGISIDELGNLYVGDFYDKSAIRKITPDGVVSTFEISGYEVVYPTGIAFDSFGNMYFTDVSLDDIVRVFPEGEAVDITDGLANFNGAYNLVIDASDIIYAVDDDNHKVLKIEPSYSYKLTSKEVGAVGNYSVVLKADDGRGGITEQSFTITVLNEAPTDIILDVTQIEENNTAGQKIGDFSSTDPNTGDAHTYTLVSGTGDTDNARFKIESGALVANAVFNFEEKSAYSIRVLTTDAGNLTFEKSLTITIADANDVPTAIGTSSETSIIENRPVGTSITTLTTTDEDANDLHTYTLVAGTGDTDNASFTIEEGALKVAEVFDFETKSGYSIRVRSTDLEGSYTESIFSIEITNEAEANITTDSDGSFELTTLGFTTSKKWTLTNTGDRNTEIIVTSSSQAFRITPGSVIVPAGESKEVIASFSPSEAQVYEGVITFTYLIAGERESKILINVSGEGTIVTEIEDPSILERKVEVFPNPATEQLTIDLSNLGIERPNLSIISSDGRGLWNRQEVIEKRVAVDISNYANGLYIVLVTDGQTVIRKKVIIKH
ncbi:Calx-beta domain-containing protein [Roseivirga sp.]|uniref:Calx-beta domain-containing protein n=1 Tax=Roseivirga sp. TaxID=1964215 RepID=UPI003B51E278